LQRKDREARHIYSIAKNNGTLVDEPDQILHEIKTQYEQLFQSDGASETAFNFFVENCTIPSLNETDKALLESPITVEEVKDAIQATHGGKTPGYDGIPIEMYWLFCDTISVFLCRLFNYFLDCGYMHDTAYMGIISLLYKGKGERFLRENWRPLTMLNLDYKIFTKILARRLRKVMSTIVHPDQTCSVPGRKIQDSIAHVMSVIDYVNECDQNVLLVSVDHLSAFDMIEWQFIFNVFEKMNFGKNFMGMLKCILSPKTKSAVHVNGFISPFFNVERGIRQGCPLSPLIYVIATEISAIYIRKCPRLKGIPLYGKNTKITKYADDTSVFVRTWAEIAEVFKIFDLFELASGSKLKK
jgi:hypothetical protein